MIIESFSTGNGPFESPFPIAPGSSDDPDGHITVLIGKNGTRKSLALSMLMTGALDQPAHKGHGYPPVHVQIACIGRRPSRVVAVSLTPWDRFPRSWALSELSTSVPWLDDRFIYIGPRSRKGMVSARYNEAAFGRAMLENCQSFKERSEALSPIFERLGLIPAAGIRFGSRWRSRRLLGGAIPVDEAKRLREALGMRSREIERGTDFSEHWKRTIAAFTQKISTDEFALKALWTALDQARSPRVACWITTDGPRFAHGFNSIENWRCALYLGLFEINGVFFGTQGGELPKGPKGAVRDSDLSSGQWSWLSSLVSLCVVLDDNSLVLIDEPENSLHPSWQRDFIATLTAILKSCKRCHAVVATHSALIASGVREGFGNVRRLDLSESNSDGGKSVRLTISEAPPSNTYGAQVDDVYRELFDLPSTRTPEFLARVDGLLARIRDARGERPAVPKAEIEYILAARDRLPIHDPLRGILKAIAASVDPEGGAKQ